MLYTPHFFCTHLSTWFNFDCCGLILLALYLTTRSLDELKSKALCSVRHSLHWQLSGLTCWYSCVTWLFLFEQIVIPRGPINAKGLLLSCIQDKDPCIFFEPKVLYRAAVEDVPVKEYKLPLGKADILVTGKTGHITIWVWNVVLLQGNR